MPFDVAYTFTQPDDPVELDNITGRTSVDIHCYFEIFGPDRDDWYIYTDLDHRPKSEAEQELIMDSLQWLDVNSFEYKGLQDADELEVYIDDEGAETYTIDGGSLIEGMMDILPSIVRKYLNNKNGIIELVGEMFLEYDGGRGYVWEDDEGDPVSFEWEEYPHFNKQTSIASSAEHLKIRKIK